MSSEQDARKRKFDLRLTRAQYVLAVLALIHVAAFVTGALLGFAYLVRHQFNPGGISGSDTLAMILWSLGFLLLLAIGLGIATLAGFSLARIIDVTYSVTQRSLLWFKRDDHFPMSGFWWSLRFGTPNRLEWRRNQQAMMFFGCITLATFCWLIAVVPFELGMFFVTILTPGIFIGMIVFGKMVESYSPLPRRADQSAIDIRMSRLSIERRGLVVVAVLVVLTTFLCLGTWLDASAVLIGFREQNVNIRLPKEDFEEILEQATRSGFAVNPCEQLTPGATTLQHADILWQNMGTRSLIRFPSQPLWSSTGIRNEIRFKTGNAALVNVVRAGSQGRCGEVLADVLFRGSGKRLRSSAPAYILEQLPWLAGLPAGSKIRIVAHGSKGVTASATNDGTADTQQQALAVKRIVEALTKLAPANVEAEGAGWKILKQECDKRSGAQRTLCEASNRRIEIHVLDPD
jgi:hypothetical protein